ncbi:sortase domain-bontaining protein [Streptomyces massasporeus]
MGWRASAPHCPRARTPHRRGGTELDCLSKWSLAPGSGPASEPSLAAHPQDRHHARSSKRLAAPFSPEAFADPLDRCGRSLCRVGWFAAGPSPGERDAAIVAGHLDTKTAPAVFAGLSTLSPGREIHITRQDGTTATFVVHVVDDFPQDEFPDELVYADPPNAQLRLITCGGSYDHGKKRYTENTVVFAPLKLPQSGDGGAGHGEVRTDVLAPG